ncbi:hypothetical protein EfmAA55_28760 (plasmid) [Enterococcus faecium]|nr:hypothetical protein EfmAA55_28760 [Enterococcus faecium]
MFDENKTDRNDALRIADFLRRVKQFSRMFDENKTDRNDALRIADFLRIQRFTTSPIKEEKYMALQRLTRTRYQLIKQLIRTKQHFLSLMTEDFTLDELAELPLEAFCDLLQEKGKGRFKQPEKIAKAIQRAISVIYFKKKEKAVSSNQKKSLKQFNVQLP